MINFHRFGEEEESYCREDRNLVLSVKRSADGAGKKSERRVAAISAGCKRGRAAGAIILRGSSGDTPRLLRATSHGIRV